ncbi:MAG: phage portal protein [Faecalibacterium prausnitzii]
MILPSLSSTHTSATWWARATPSRLKPATTNWTKKLEKAWRQWCKARNCDVTGEQSFNQMSAYGGRP